ncbi:peptidoglycan DD-metalloendopeptidase family protein [Jeotgalibacillus soli]|uniref:M23ase beta-sheet core domain-containing protein n=1 Tax=Jeotgalibacillus soli TaxID=889306 RepID=A0A0C2R458_9BACL|nr:peptidoglycan DD-metalloendopeptidase family protein [Jeotgalibacillus soli]KIL45010.1 hypothetical protein KP78_25540 [Jeotgalibacillus soli]
MAERIEGLSISLGLDTIGIDSGLKDLKRKMSLVSSEMKAGMSVFDRSEKSVSKYETQLGLLNKKLDVNKAAVANAKDEYERMNKQHGEGSKQADLAAKKYNDEVAALNNLERHIEGVSKEMKEFQEQQRIASSGFTKLADTFEKTGGRISKIGDSFKNIGQNMSLAITAPLLGAFASLTKGTEEFRGNMANLETNALNAGFGIDFVGETLERINGIAPDVNANVEGLSNLMATNLSESGMAKAVDYLAGAVIRFPDTLKFEGLADGLQETLATGAAIGPFAELLERSGVNLDTFNDGLTTAIANGEEENYILKQLANTGLASVNEEFRKNNDELVKSREASLAFQDATSKLGTILTPIATKLTTAFNGLLTKFLELSPSSQKTGLIFAGIAAAIGPVIVGIGTLISSIGGITTALAPVMSNIAKAGGLLKWLRLGFVALTGPVGLTIGILTGLGIGFVALYKNSETFREGVANLLTRLKELGKNMLSAIKPAIAAVVQFFKDQLAVIKQFWSENSETILGALKNIGKVVAAIFKGIWETIQFFMPLVLAIIKSVWGNIKGVITGALDIIMGVVKVFSGLFTGDFKKMWEGLKQIFKGAITFIWNFIQLTFYGKVLGGAKAFILSFRTFFTSMWTTLRNLFSTSITAVFNFLKNGWTKANTITVTIFRTIFNFLRSIWSSIWTTIRTTISSMSSGISGTFSAIRSSITNLATRAKEGVLTQWRNLRDGVTTLAGNLKSKVDDVFKNMVDGAKALPGKIRDGIINAKDKAVKGIKDLGNAMVGKFGSVVNGMIGGINNITGKLGIDTKIKEWEVETFAKGTDAHKGGPMIVGDKYGREIVRFPNGKTILSPDTDTLIPNAPKGTQVIPNYLTEKILKGEVPMYNMGAGLKDWLGDIWSYASNPGKLISKMIESLGLSIKGLTGGAASMAKGAFSFVKDKAVDFIKGMFDSGGSGNVPMSFGNLIKTSGFGYRVHPITGRSHLHGGVDFAGPIGTAIKAQVGGMVTSSGWNNGGYGNLVTIKNGIYDYYYAHLQRAIARVGASVKKGDIIGTLGNTGQSTGPHLHYEVRKNGQRINPGIGGFAEGGLIKKEQLAWVGEGNKEEVMIPTGDRSKRPAAMKLLALAAKKLGADGGSFGSTSPTRLPNSTGGSSRTEQLLEQLILLLQNSAKTPFTIQPAAVNIDSQQVGEITFDVNQQLFASASNNNLFMKGLKLK